MPARRGLRAQERARSRLTSSARRQPAGVSSSTAARWLAPALLTSAPEAAERVGERLDHVAGRGRRGRAGATRARRPRLDQARRLLGARLVGVPGDADVEAAPRQRDRRRAADPRVRPGDDHRAAHATATAARSSVGSRATSARAARRRPARRAARDARVEVLELAS